MRQSFPKLYERSINLHDQTDLYQTLKSFSVPDLFCIVNYPRGNPHGISHRELHGLEVVADYFHKSISCAPDSVFLFHETQLVEHEDGTAVIICKFSGTGTRLHTVSAMTDGLRRPDHPAEKVLRRTAQAKSYIQPSTVPMPVPSSASTASPAAVVPTIKQPVLFKATVNKYDRYKKRKTATIGAFVTHNDFSEGSIKRRSTQHPRAAAAQAQASALVKNGNAFGGNHHHNNGLTLTATDVAALALLPVDIMVAGKETTFGHSALLPVPLKWCIQGIQKFYINADHKVYKMHCLIQFK